MSTGAAAVPVLGIDGVAPIRNDSIGFKVWNLDEIYFSSGTGSGKFIPKVGDLVIAFTNSMLSYKRVISIDSTTLNPTLKTLADDDTDGDLGTNVIMGVGPGTPNETYRIYIDKQTNPYTLSVDRRCVISGSDAVKCKLFKGAVSAGDVISKVYSADFSTYIGNTVDLELVYQIPGVTSSYKIIPTCHTKADLMDNELVTAVFYSSTGNVISKHQLLVECTDFIASTATGVKYIMSVDLVSQFMSGGVLKFPLGLPLSSLDHLCAITYSDGSVDRIPIDSTRAVLYGLSGFVSSIVGMKIPLVLKYTLRPQEVADNSATFISKAYSLEVIPTNAQYGVKLYPCLKWNTALKKYDLRWWLLTLGRNNYYDVTANVDYLPNYAFDASNTNEQEVRVSIDMKDVGAGYNTYKHLQNVKINLPIGKASHLSLTEHWTIDNDGMGGVMETMYAKRGTKGVVINNSITSSSEWLDKTYYASKPLVNPTTEVEPLEPTHMLIKVTEVIAGAPAVVRSVTVPISNFDTEIMGLGTPAGLVDNVTVVFLRMLPGGTIWYLSVIEMPFI